MGKVQYITSTKKNNKINNHRLITVVLLYHSFVSRMKSFGNVAMIPINDKERLIDMHIEQIVKQINNVEIILSIGYDSQKVQSYVQKKYKHLNIRCVENTKYDNSSICESLRLAINNTYNNRILIMSGNIIYDKSILSKLISNEAITVLSDSGCNNTLDIGVNIDDETKNIAHVSYGLVSHKWSELIYLSKDSHINEIKRCLSQKDFQNKILYELLNNMIKKKIKIKYVNTAAPIMKINNKE